MRWMPWRHIWLVAILGCIVISIPSVFPAQGAAAGLKPPVHLTSAQDHQRMMNLLHIKSLRPGADPNRPNAPNAVNYDESKANPYPHLPNPLFLNDGKPVTSPSMWWKLRRPEIIKDFNDDVYGRVPRNVPSVKWLLLSVTHETVGVTPVVTKHLVGHVDNSAYPLVGVNIRLALTTPARARGPVPVILELGFDPAIMRKFFAMLRARGIKLPPPGPTWQEQVLAQGWGYAIYYPTDVQPDNGAGLTEGIIGLCNHGQPRQPDDWGALRAWAWGATRTAAMRQANSCAPWKRISRSRRTCPSPETG